MHVINTSFAGNYDAFVRTRAELEDAQMKKFRWEQDQISNMKEYIARFGHGSAKLARQAQSKEKTLDKMVQGGLTEKVQGDHVVRLRFTDVGKLPPPVLQFADVTFGYSPDRVLYRNVSTHSPLHARHVIHHIVSPNLISILYSTASRRYLHIALPGQSSLCPSVA